MKHQKMSRNIKKHQETSRNVKKHQETSRNIKKHQETSRNIKKHQEMSRNVKKCQETFFCLFKLWGGGSGAGPQEERSAKVLWVLTLDFGLELDNHRLAARGASAEDLISK